jgi:hypothetical protein
MVFECDAYDAVREHFWYLFEEFGEWKALGIQYVLVGAAWLSLCSNVKAA